MVKILAPAKLILSGEYSVVRNKPALAVALNYFTHCEIIDNKNITAGVELIIPQFNLNKFYSWQELLKLEISLQHKYQNFTDALISISEVLESPIELCWFAIIYFLKNSQEHINYQSSITINLSSEIPIGSGMGSSASIIIATMQGLNKFYNLNLCDNTVYQLALQAENLQHGYSSGVDIKTIMHGGINYFQADHQANHIENFDITIENMDFYLINTGKPESSTGECSEKVKEKFNANHIIWNEFSQCTELLKTNLEKESKFNIIHYIKTNHRLLNQLGIVPEHVNNFIRKIENGAISGAAKICGAGSISGDSAGMVIAIGEFSSIKKLCEQYNFSLENLAGRIFYG